MAMTTLRTEQDAPDYEPKTFWRGRAMMTVTSKVEEQSARGRGWTDVPPPTRKKTDEDRLAGR